MSEVVTKRIVERDGKFCVLSENGERNFGCYDSMERAQERLRQIEHFKKSFTTGDLTGGLAAPGQGVPRRARDLEPPFSVTVDIFEGGKLAVRHMAFGETKDRADATLKSHAKYDALLSAQLAGRTVEKANITYRKRATVAKVIPTSGRVAIGFLLPPDLAARVGLEGPNTEKIENLHLTLGYFGRLEELRPDAIARLCQLTEDLAWSHTSPALLGFLSGFGRFKASSSSDGKDVFYLSFDSPDLLPLRARLASSAMAAEIPLRSAHGFDPHITLAYLDPSEPDPITKPIPDELIAFGGVTLMVEHWRYFFPFMAQPTEAYGELLKTAPPATALKTAYISHLQENGFDPGQGKNVEAEEVGSVADGMLYRVTDGYGEWYFKGSEAGISWVAQKMPDVRAFAVSSALEKTFTKEYVKSLGWGDAAWDEAILDSLAPITKALTVMKADSEQRYTLGVAYPAKELDAHREFMNPEQLEKAAWTALAKGLRLGVMHKAGTDGAAQVVESYIYRGPRWEIAGQIVESGDWLVGAIWNEETWARIQAGELTGYSMQGWATRS